jgi:hypothetical protein
MDALSHATIGVPTPAEDEHQYTWAKVRSRFGPVGATGWSPLHNRVKWWSNWQETFAEVHLGRQ